jgi:hypothetical protein
MKKVSDELFLAITVEANNCFHPEAVKRVEQILSATIKMIRNINAEYEGVEYNPILKSVPDA